MTPKMILRAKWFKQDKWYKLLHTSYCKQSKQGEKERRKYGVKISIHLLSSIPSIKIVINNSHDFYDSFYR